MDQTIIIVLIFLLVGGYFVYTILQRQRQFQLICSDEHLLEIREVFVELFEEVWTEFIQKNENNSEVNFSSTENQDEVKELSLGSVADEKPKYRLTSQNFLITYKIMPIQLHNKDLFINHFSFSSVNSYFFPRNLVYMAVYFSIILDIPPETFDYTVHQANKGTSGFLFCKIDKQVDVMQYKRELTLIASGDNTVDSIPECASQESDENTSNEKEAKEKGLASEQELKQTEPVSYTHLTLPTKRIV